MKQKQKQYGSLALTAVLILSLFAGIRSLAAAGTTLSFSDSGIAETVSGSGYEINGTALSIEENGTYRIKGSCAEGSIEVAKGLTDVTLIFDNLTLASSSTAPVTVKKDSSVSIVTSGTTTLSDNEDAALEDVDDSFEGAAIKIKSRSTVTFSGDGTLVIAGNAKNGIKGASTSGLLFLSGTYQVIAANNGIACDGSIIINNGTFVLDTGNDAIKSVPEADDSDSAGTITINGGSFFVAADGDGISADADLVINDGTFDITTLTGYGDGTFDKDTMSCKGLKASGDRELENNMLITGGSFVLNTADDAVHSDAYVTVTGGSFTIRTGDDGMHADTTLTVGENGGSSTLPDIDILTSYEGLEGGTVYMYSGSSAVTASDDGINAAGGSTSGTDTGFGGDNIFTPGGAPGGRNGLGGTFGTAADADYSINIYGGTIAVDALGDGLDSNGPLNLYGGDITIFSMAAGGDNTPFDADGNILFQGATVFGAGSAGMGEAISPASQTYYVNRASYKAGTVVNVKNGDVTLASKTLPRNANYILYTSPSLNTSALTVTTGAEAEKTISAATDPCAFGHTWDAGKVTAEATSENEGEKTYTCSICGAVRTEILARQTENASAMYRLYNPASGEHLYTGDVNERQVLLSTGAWEDEGIAWYAPAVSETPVYRLFNTTSGEHLYTADENEKTYCPPRATGIMKELPGTAMTPMERRFTGCSIRALHPLRPIIIQRMPMNTMC